MAAAVRSARAARVTVGFDVALVGKTLDPTIQRFSRSCARPQRLTTEFFGSSPMMQVPIMWAAVFQFIRPVVASINGLASGFSGGGGAGGISAPIIRNNSVETSMPRFNAFATYVPMSKLKRG